jgi:hypothetical protein
MVDAKYAYLIGVGIFFVPWLFFFFTRKDLRREMLLMSLLVGLGTVFTEYYWWTIDWWHPETITGTRVGIEDFLLGIANGGVAAVVYSYFFKKSHYKIPTDSNKSQALSVGLLTFAVLSFGFWGLRLTSFYACVGAMILGSILLFYFRKDLLLNGIYSGLIMLLLSFPPYLIGEALSPGFLDNSWHYSMLTNLRFLGIPIEDLIFYFLFGIWVGPLYELMFAKKQRKRV